MTDEDNGSYDLDTALKIASDPNENINDRINAVNFFREEAHDIVIPVLKKIINEEQNTRLRKNALTSLVEIDPIQAQHELIKVIKDSNNTQNLIRYAIFEAEDLGPQIVPEFANLLLELNNWFAIEYLLYSLRTKGKGNEKVISAISELLDKREDEEEREYLIITLGKVGNETVIPILSEIYRESNGEYEGNFALEALGDISSSQAIPILLEVLETDNAFNRMTAISSLGKIGDNSIIQNLLDVLEKEKDTDVITTILNTLGSLRDISTLSVILSKLNDNIIELRSAALDALDNFDHEDTILPLFRMILKEQDFELENKIAEQINKKSCKTWIQKTDQILSIINKSNLKRSEINSKILISSIKPSEQLLDKDNNLLTDYLIGNSVDKDNRFTALLAKLILESAGESTVIAGERINKFTKDNNLSSDTLKKLRIEIGGETALDPVLSEVLKPQMDEYFMSPIKTLNSLTFESWGEISQSAKTGFEARKRMSEGIYYIGIGLVILSSLAFFSGLLTPEQMFGAGVSFFSGISTIFMITYAGPLKDIQQSVEDLGIASAAFIGYVHRVLEISHTFSYYYLSQKMTFEEMEKSSKLIERAMMDAYELLSKKRLPSEDLYNELNEKLNKIIENIEKT